MVAFLKQNSEYPLLVSEATIPVHTQNTLSGACSCSVYSSKPTAGLKTNKTNLGENEQRLNFKTDESACGLMAMETVYSLFSLRIRPTWAAVVKFQGISC